MNHLELLQALFFLRGSEGVALSDIYSIVGKNDIGYALYLLSSLEDSFEATPLQIKFIPDAKKYHLILPHNAIASLEQKEILRTQLSKAARATLAYIIMNVVREEQVTVAWLKKIRGSNVMNHLEELAKSGYISIEETHIILTNKLISEIDVSALVKKLESAEKVLE